MRQKIPLFFCFILLIGLVFLIAPARAYVTDYVYPSDDAKILNLAPDTNYGSNPTDTLGNMTEWSGTPTFHIGYYKFMMSDFAPDLKTGEDISYTNFFFDLYSDFHFDWHEADNFFQLCYTLNQTWLEDELTWNDSPSYQDTNEIVEVTGMDQYFSWDMREISLDVQDAIENDNNFTVVIVYYGSTQGFNAREREYGGISYDPRIRIEYNIISPDDKIYEREPSLSAFPIALGMMLGIGDFGGRMLASVIVILIFMLPTAYASKDLKDPTIPLIVVGFSVLGLLIGIGYLPVWVLLIVVLMIALLYANKIGGFIKH